MRSRCQISQSDAESYLEIAAGNVDVAIELWENSWELVETAESSLTMDIGAGVGGVDVDMQRLVYESVMNSNFPRTRSERTTRTNTMRVHSDCRLGRLSRQSSVDSTILDDEGFDINRHFHDRFSVERVRYMKRIYKMLKKIHQSRSFSLTKPNDEYVVMTMSVDPTSSRPSNFRYTALNGCDCSHSQFRMLPPIQEFLQENYRNQVSTRGTFCYRSSMSGKLAYDMKYLEHIIRSLPSSVQKIVIEIRDAEYTEPIRSFRCESNERDYMYKGQPFEAAFTAAYGLPRIQMQQCADPQTINGCTMGRAHGHDFTPVLLEFICRLYILLHDRRTPLGLELILKDNTSPDSESRCDIFIEENNDTSRHTHRYHNRTRVHMPNCWAFGTFNRVASNIKPCNGLLLFSWAATHDYGCQLSLGYILFEGKSFVISWNKRQQCAYLNGVRNSWTNLYEDGDTRTKMKLQDHVWREFFSMLDLVARMIQRGEFPADGQATPPPHEISQDQCMYSIERLEAMENCRAFTQSNVWKQCFLLFHIVSEGLRNYTQIDRSEFDTLGQRFLEITYLDES